jgi:hypothetical protein
MAGSPKKRARREAERMRRAAAHAEAQPSQPVADQGGVVSGSPISSLPAPLRGEILPPIKDEEVTRTAFRRAMRKKAQEHAEKAVGVLARNLDSGDPEIASKAANDILKWSGLDKLDLEGGGEALAIAIMRFSDQDKGTSLV